MQRRLIAITMALTASLGMMACGKKKAKDDGPSTTGAGGTGAGGAGDGTSAAGGAGDNDPTRSASGGAALTGLKAETECPKSLGGSDKGIARTIKKECGEIAITEDYYIDNSEVTLEAGVRLVAKPGVRIKVGYYEPARLTVKGTAAEPVLFTTSGDKAAGSWAGIDLFKNAARSSIVGAIIEYAGTEDGGALNIEAEDVVVKDTIIRDAKEIGIRVGNETTVKELAGLTLERAGVLAITLPPTSVASLGASTFKDGGFVQIRGGTVDRSGTWRNPGTYYVSDEVIYVDGKNARAIVTIEAGTELRFGRDAGMRVGYYHPGTLKVVGTKDKVVTFKPKEGAEPGSWQGLAVHSSGELTIEHAVLEHGGGQNDNDGVLSAQNESVLSVKETVLRGHSVAINAVDGAKLKTVETVTFDGNKIAAIIHPDLFGAFAATNVYTNPQPIDILNGAVNHDQTWSAQPQAEIRLAQTVDIDKATLSLTPGVELRFDGDAKLRIGYYQKGNLRAVGAADKPIVLRGVRDEKDAWTGLEVHANADGTLFDHVVFADTSGDAAIVVDGRARVEVKNVVVKRSKAAVKWDCDSKVTQSDIKLEGGGKVAIEPTGC